MKPLLAIVYAALFGAGVAALVLTLCGVLMLPKVQHDHLPVDSLHCVRRGNRCADSFIDFLEC